MPFAQAGNALDVDIESVASTELLTRPGPGELAEVVLEAGRGDDLKDPADGVTRVPERVPLTARLEGQIARLRVDDIVAEQRAQPPLEDVAVLVLTGMPVERRGEVPRPDRMLDEREPPPESSPEIMKRTPSPPRSTAAPSREPMMRGPCDASNRVVPVTSRSP